MSVCGLIYVFALTGAVTANSDPEMPTHDWKINPLVVKTSGHVLSVEQLQVILLVLHIKISLLV